MNTTLIEHRGACACGAVTFVYCTGQVQSELHPRACQCEYCLPKALTYLSDPASSLRVTLRDTRYLYAHRFGTGTADFMHCVICNHQVFVRCEVEGQTYALVSAPALSAYGDLALSERVDYDGELLDERLQRRVANWIPELIIEVDPARVP